MQRQCTGWPACSTGQIALHRADQEVVARGWDYSGIKDAEARGAACCQLVWWSEASVGRELVGLQQSTIKRRTKLKGKPKQRAWDLCRFDACKCGHWGDAGCYCSIHSPVTLSLGYVRTTKWEVTAHKGNDKEPVSLESEI